MSQFDQLINRDHSWSEKYDARRRLYGRDDAMPMWVADMDFATPEFVINALQQRLQHPILGYSQFPQQLKQTVVDWQTRQHQWTPAADSVLWLSGVVSGLYLAVQTFTRPGDGVMVFTPIYPPFMKSVTDQNRRLVTQALHLINNRYELDFDAIEQQIQSQQVTLLMISNPHNPAGRLWTQAELSQLGQICLRHQVKLVVDEIWSDLNHSQQPHIPLAAIATELADICITLNSASKTFNLAALHSAYAIIANPTMRQAFSQTQQQTRAAEPNLFGMIALQAAYSDQGQAWLQDLNRYIGGLVDEAETFFKPADMPQLMRPQASYLLWLDCRHLFANDAEMQAWWLNEAGLALSAGTHFSAAGSGFMRMNIGLPRARLQQAFSQIKQACLHR